jgi:hypothetical protein
LTAPSFFCGMSNLTLDSSLRLCYYVCNALEKRGGKLSKYSEEDVTYMVEKYTLHPTPETVELLAFDLNKTPRSIIGKLARMRVYKPRSAYKPKYGEVPVTKEQLIIDLAGMYDLEVEKLRGLEKSQKESLLYLVSSLRETLED